MLSSVAGCVWHCVGCVWYCVDCVGLCSRRWLRCSKSRYHDWCCSSSHWLWKCFDQPLLIVDFL